MSARTLIQHCIGVKMALIAGKGQHAALLVVADIEELSLRQRLGRTIPDHQPQSECKPAPPRRGRIIL